MAENESPPDSEQGASTLERVVQQLSTADPQAFYAQARSFEQAAKEIEDAKIQLTKYQRLLDDAWRSDENKQHNQVTNTIRHLELLVSSVQESDYPRLLRQMGDAVGESKRRLQELQEAKKEAKDDDARDEIDKRATKVLENLAASYRQFGGMFAPLPEETVTARKLEHESYQPKQETSAAGGVPAARTAPDNASTSTSPSSSGPSSGHHEQVEGTSLHSTSEALSHATLAQTGSSHTGSSHPTSSHPASSQPTSFHPTSSQQGSSHPAHVQLATSHPSQTQMASDHLGASHMSSLLSSSSVASGRTQTREPAQFARFSSLGNDRVSGSAFSEDAAVPTPVAAAGFSAPAMEQPRGSVLGRSPAPSVGGGMRAPAGQGFDFMNTSRPSQLTTTAGPAIPTEFSSPTRTTPADVRLGDPNATRAPGIPMPSTGQLLGAPSVSSPSASSSFEQVRTQQTVGTAATSSFVPGSGLQVRPVGPVAAEPLLLAGAPVSGPSSTTSAGPMGVPPTSLMHQPGSALGASGRTGESVWVRAEPGSWNGAQPVAGGLGRRGDTGKRKERE